MKKIIFLISCVLVVILIYVIKSDKKVIYFEISDNYIVGGESVKYLSNKKLLEDHVYYKNTDNYRLIDIYNDITIDNMKFLSSKEENISSFNFDLYIPYNQKNILLKMFEWKEK